MHRVEFASVAEAHRLAIRSRMQQGLLVVLDAEYQANSVGNMYYEAG
jgi:hypothetical protein